MNWIRTTKLLFLLLTLVSIRTVWASEAEAKTKHARTKSSWFSMDNHLQISPELEDKINQLQQFASKQIFQISEIIEGSSELQSLITIQGIVQKLLNMNMQHETKRHVEQLDAQKQEEQKETKEKAAASQSPLPRKRRNSLSPQQTIQASLEEIQKILLTLNESIQQRIKKYTSDLQQTQTPEDTALINALQQKIKAVTSLIERINPLLKKYSPPRDAASSLGLETPHSNIDEFKPELEMFKKLLTEEVIPVFKTGLSGIFDRTIKDLKESLNDVVKNLSFNLSAQLKSQLREVIGYPSILVIYTLLNDIKENHSAYNDEELSKKITNILNEMQCTLQGLDDTSDMQKPLFEIQIALDEGHEAWNKTKIIVRKKFIDEYITKYAHPRINSLLKNNCGLHGSLTDIMNQMKEKLLDVAQTFNKGFSQTLDRSINRDLPRTLKKGVCYLTLGTIAACAACHIIWHDLPWRSHVKNMGIVAGSIIGMVFVDPIIDYFRPRARN